MPHNLTDVDAFTSPVVVPDGTDSHTILAEYIAAVGQALANRTRNLKNITAKLDDPNVFTDTNKFNLGPIEVDDDDATHAALVVRNTAADDSHAAGANKWKAELGFNIGGGVGYVNVYAGAAAGEAQFIIALNAVWDPTSQLWAKDDTGSHSLALLFDQDLGMRISRKAAGVGTWATWPTTLGDLALPGALTAGTLATTGDVTAGDDLIANDDINAGGDVSANGDVTIGGNFFRSPAPTTDFIVSIFDAIGLDNGSGSGFALDYDASGVPYLKGSGATKIIAVPFKLPVGGSFTKAVVLADVTGDLVGEVTKRSAYNWGPSGGGAGAAPSESTLDTYGVIGAGGGSVVGYEATFSETVVRTADYRFTFHATATVKIYGFLVTCTEPGPRN